MGVITKKTKGEKPRVEELVRRAQRGDAEAFTQLIEQNKKGLYAAARAVLHSDEDAADAMQDAVLQGWQKLPRLAQPAFFKTWMTRILLYRCYDILRRRRRTVPLEEAAPAACAPHGGERLEVADALAHLAQSDRLVLTMFYWQDLPTRQIAQTLGVSEAAVRTRLARARKRFKQQWQEKEDAI